jgi:hypothetical protein
MTDSSPKSFFIKVKGKQLGPLSDSRVRELVKQGQVNRATPISSDGKTWQKAGEIETIFSAAKEPEMKTGGGASGAKWYYSIGGARNGPVDASQIELLLKSGTISSGNLVWRQGMSDWQPMNVVPELADVLAAVTPADPLAGLGGFPSSEGTPIQNPFWQQPQGVGYPSRSAGVKGKVSVQDDEETQYARGRVYGPALAMQIYSGLSLVVLAVWIALIFLGFSAIIVENVNSYIPNEEETAGAVIGATLYALQAGIAMLIGMLIYVGAGRMRKLKSYGLAMTASILGMIPCLSPCCLFGLPFGIWAIITLSDPRVKQSFS